MAAITLRFKIHTRFKPPLQKYYDLQNEVSHDRDTFKVLDLPSNDFYL